MNDPTGILILNQIISQRKTQAWLRRTFGTVEDWNDEFDIIISNHLFCGSFFKFRKKHGRDCYIHNDTKGQDLKKKNMQFLIPHLVHK